MKIFYFDILKKEYGEEEYETVSPMHYRSPWNQRIDKDTVYPAVYGVVPGLLRPGRSWTEGEGEGAVQRVYPECKGPTEQEKKYL